MKKIIALLLALTMLLALCACGQAPAAESKTPENTDTPADTGTPAADEPVTLRLYTRYSDDDSTKRIDYAIEKLKEEYPNVTIEIEAMPADDGVALKAMAATGDMPDIFSLSGSDLIAALAEYGSIQDMTPYLEANGFLDKVIETEKVKVYFTDGNAYCIPFNGTEMANFFANTEIFQQYNLEIPQTLDELIECAKVFSANGMCTIPVFASEGWITNAFFNAILTRFDSRGLDALYSGEASINDEAYLKAATVLYDLQQAGAFPAGVANMAYENCTELWYNGQSAMFFNGEWEADATYAALGDKAQLMAYPAASEDTIEASKTSVVGGTGSCTGLSVFAGSKNYELAIDIACRLSELMVQHDYIYRGKACFALDVTEGLTREVEPCSLIQQIGELRPTLTHTTQLFSTVAPEISAAVAESAQAIMAGTMTPEEFIENVAFACEG